jgi:hypothetical protein
MTLAVKLSWTQPRNLHPRQKRISGQENSALSQISFCSWRTTFSCLARLVVCIAELTHAAIWQEIFLLCLVLTYHAASNERQRMLISCNYRACITQPCDQREYSSTQDPETVPICNSDDDPQITVPRPTSRTATSRLDDCKFPLNPTTVQNEILIGQNKKLKFCRRMQ